MIIIITICSLNCLNIIFSDFLEGGERVDCLYYLTDEHIYIYIYIYFFFCCEKLIYLNQQNTVQDSRKKKKENTRRKGRRYMAVVI